MESTEIATPGSVAHLFGGLGSGDEEGEEDEEGEDGEESDDIPLSDRFHLSIFNKGQKRKREDSEEPDDDDVPDDDEDYFDEHDDDDDSRDDDYLPKRRKVLPFPIPVLADPSFLILLLLTSPHSLRLQRRLYLNLARHRQGCA
jgi:hypothetical protein